MSLSLLLGLANDLDNWPWPSYYDDDFGFGIYPHELNYLRRNRPRLSPQPLAEPQQQATTPQRCVGKAISAVGKDGFQVCMEVQQFKPSELMVKTVDNKVVIEGKHEERQDEYGYISRHFVRRYELPKNYDPALVTSALSSNGVLTIKAPPPSKSIQSNERIIQIQQTEPVHLTVNGHPKEENGDENKE